MPSLNWFNLNRVSGGPSYFGNVNRLAAPFYWNEWLFGVVITAAAFITVLLLLSPIYKHQLRTVSLVTTSILMGGAFVLALVMPWWQTAGPQTITAPIRVQDTEYVDMTVEIHLGLNYVNITLVKVPQDSSEQPQKAEIVLPRLLPRDSLKSIGAPYENKNEVEKIQFNEKIELKTANEMRDQFRSALERGLPVPILTIINYFSHQEEGFRWSVYYRQAGYFAQFTLILTLICWAWMNIFFLVVPQHGAIAMITTGLLALLTNFLYWILLPPKDLLIYIEGEFLQFTFDGCYWTVFTTGLVALFTGSVLLIVETRKPGSLSFDLELDHDVKAKLLNKVIQRRSVKLEPSVAFSEHKRLKQTISVIDGTAAGYVESSVSDTKTDSGILTADSVATSALLSHHQQMNSSTDLEQIATFDGSYLKSTVTNMIHAEDAPKIYSYTFRNGRELPSFHESTISLNSDSGPRYLESIVDEDIIVHKPAESQPSSALGDESEHLPSDTSEKEDWHDPLEFEETARIESDSEEDTFCSTFASAKKPSPRRRSQRAPSIGSHRDIFGNS